MPKFRSFKDDVLTPPIASALQQPRMHNVAHKMRVVLIHVSRGWGGSAKVALSRSNAVIPRLILHAHDVNSVFAFSGIQKCTRACWGCFATCAPVVKVSFSALQLRQVARRGGFQAGGRWAADALGWRFRIPLRDVMGWEGEWELAAGCTRYSPRGCAALSRLLGCCRCFKSPRARSPQLLARVRLQNNAIAT
jgi:hypothetical protein